MFVSGTSAFCAITAPTSLISPHKKLTFLAFADLETGREETKVRVWWHEHWQTRYSSKEAEEEVNMPTQTPRVQQVRAEIAFFSPHLVRSRAFLDRSISANEAAEHVRVRVRTIQLLLRRF